MTPTPTPPIRTAALLAIGSELTRGETRDTNGGDLAAGLSALGVQVRAVTDLPDDLETVGQALRAALARVDLIVTTGGLGPTPDDLTREAIAAVCAERPAEDPALLAWLEELFTRRGRTMAPLNRKQAWLIPSARPLPNARGTAPGWWVERPGGRLIVALPGPPREMAAMWQAEALPRLRARGIGQDRASAILRLTGIGESDAAALIGEEILRAANPDVATYARDAAVDVRIEARAEDGHGAAELLAGGLARLEPLLAPWTFARDAEGWPEALGRRLAGRRVGAVEVGTGGHLADLIGTAPWLVRLELLAASEADVRWLAVAAREQAGVAVGLAVSVVARGADTAVRIGLADEGGATVDEATAFLGGSDGRRRAALAACAALWRHLDPLGPAGARRPLRGPGR